MGPFEMERKEKPPIKNTLLDLDGPVPVVAISQKEKRLIFSDSVEARENLRSLDARKFFPINS